MKIEFEITSAAHIKALELDAQQYNAQEAAAVAQYNASLPKMFTGSGGKALAHPDAKAAPVPLTVEAYVLRLVGQMLDAKAEQYDTDPDKIDAEESEVMAAFAARKAKLSGA